ncbi:RHS repeat domain-containing protein [Stieleria neptunia]|uniref:RHS repeat domain-containing protein n=1 Tax=Stieleria neptunia TaxID=2527979 RepID=UPI0018D225EB|nr:RHS repeat-associated core domain-containing protein [Stieleria neptunia]
MRHSHGTQPYSINALTDSSGTIKARYAYDAYGGLSIFDSSGTARTSTAEDNRYTYTGREYDDVLDLYHYRARMYNAIAGRFCSRDPIGFNEDGYLLYEYVRSTPLRLRDPYGLQRDGENEKKNLGPKDPAGRSCPDEHKCFVAVCVECGNPNWERDLLREFLEGNPQFPSTGHAAVCWNCKDVPKEVRKKFRISRTPPQQCVGFHPTSKNPVDTAPGKPFFQFDRMKKRCDAAYMYRVCPETIEKVLYGIAKDFEEEWMYNVFAIDGDHCTSRACRKLRDAGIPCPLIIDPRTICEDPDSIKRRKSR